MDPINNILGPDRRKLYRSQATVHEERYFDCPHCGVMLSDEGTAGNVPTINLGSVVTCPNCGYRTKITKVQ